MLKKDTDIHDCDLLNEEVGLLVIAAERTRDYAKGLLRRRNRSCGVGSFGVDHMCGYICGRPKQVGAVTQTYCCDHSWCFPLSDCMWNVCGGVSQMFKRRRQRLVLREMRVEKEVEQLVSFEVWFSADRCVALQSGPNTARRAAGTRWRSGRFLLQTDWNRDGRQVVVRSAKRRRQQLHSRNHVRYDRRH